MSGHTKLKHLNDNDSVNLWERKLTYLTLVEFMSQMQHRKAAHQGGAEVESDMKSKMVWAPSNVEHLFPRQSCIKNLLNPLPADRCLGLQ